MRTNITRVMLIAILAALTWAGLALALPAPEAEGYIALRVNAAGRAEAVGADVLAQPERYRQVYIVAAGYTAGESQRFTDDVVSLVEGMGNLGRGVFTDVYRERIVYIAQWTPGPALGAGEPARFGAGLFMHPVRAGHVGLSHDTAELATTLDRFKSERLGTFAPLCAFILYNHDNPEGRAIIASAVLPTMMIHDLRDRAVRGYGVARMTRLGAHNGPDALVAAHELGHGALNWCDEYSERALRGRHIRDLDPLTPLLLMDGSAMGRRLALGTLTRTIDLRLSEGLAANGWDNVALGRRGPGGLAFGAAGGMFFPRGTWHEDPASLMRTTGRAMNPRDAHPESHKRSLRMAFEGAGPQRPNDRLRAAGPSTAVFPITGPRASVWLMDADKHHRWQPTVRYEVEVRWTDPREGAQTRTFMGEPDLLTVDLHRSLLTRAGGWALGLARALGVRELDLHRAGGGRINLDFSIRDVVQSALPARHWPLPYQSVRVELPLARTTYRWRFRTFNGAQWSDWTPWTTLRRGA